MPNKERPAKRVIFSSDDIRIVDPQGGGPAKVFKNVTEEFKNNLIIQIEDSMINILSEDIESFAMIVELESKALAKSHRPTTIFNENTCPFIGDIGIDIHSKVGRFIIKATRTGLNNLRNRINSISLTSKKPLSELSTIVSINPFSANINISLLKNEDDFIIRLINLSDIELDEKNKSLFYKFLAKYELEYNQVSKSLPFFRAKLNNKVDSPAFLEELNNNPIIFSVKKAKSLHVMPLSTEEYSDHEVFLSDPDENIEYPVVGVVDTSIKSECIHLLSWYEGEETAIIDEDKDYEHGTFVAGLITNSFNLNPHNSHFPRSQSKVFSVGVLDSTGRASIDEIYQMLVRAQIERPDIKVWNLSLGGEVPVSLAEISEFAILLDKFQEEYSSLCVIAAGNIDDPSHFRKWPIEANCPKDEQRISSPGDSVLGITVASMAHTNGIVRLNEPSIFSRSGPVANLVLKPDLSHYGGNNNLDFSPVGVTSLSTNNYQLSQQCGTSYSTPLVSTIAANLWKIMGQETKRHTIKGLLSHSARLRTEVAPEDKLYYGWGMPLNIDNYMYCNENEVTMILEGDIGSNVEIVGKLPFPMPDSLRTADGKIKGEFFMTVTYDSPLDYNRALEYCLVNIEVGLGEALEDGTFSGKIPAESNGFEQELINGSYKWSPVKVYHKKFLRGANVENWKLQVKMTTREGYLPSDDFRIPFSVILTIRALDPEVQVYNEMSRLMDQYNWQVESAIIPVEPRIKI